MEIRITAPKGNGISGEYQLLASSSLFPQEVRNHLAAGTPKVQAGSNNDAQRDALYTYLNGGSVQDKDGSTWSFSVDRPAKGHVIVKLESRRKDGSRATYTATLAV